MISTLAVGAASGLSLIVAIGAQNAYVLRQGLAREHVLPVVAICAISDVLLITAGVAGLGSVVTRAGWALELARWFGVAFLTWYGVKTLWSALRPDGAALSTGGHTAPTRGSAVAKVTALTWLNPHVYLDTVLLLGALATRQGDGRWWFALGAGLASIAWFALLGFGARALAPLLTGPRSWQILDLLIAGTMFAIAIRLALD